jgi:lysophospholipase L1-like esterase
MVPTPASPPAGPPSTSLDPNSRDAAGAADEHRFLALGDSYTIGEGVPVSERWPVQLVQRLREEGVAITEPQIVARTGWTTLNLSSGIRDMERREPYSLVTLLIGVNNQYGGLAVEEYLAEFHGLLQRAVVLAGKEPSHVIVLSIPDWSVTPFAGARDRSRIAAEIDLFNSTNREVAARFGVRYVDITPISREAETDLGLLASDRLHPSGEMYELWVELILPEARDVLRDR